jgi:spore maturation protein CgeB
LKVLFASYKYDYNDKTRGESYEYTQFYSSLANIDGYNVEFFDCSDFNDIEIRKKNNVELIKKVKEFKPDILFHTFFQDQISKDTFNFIKNETNTTSVCFVFDDFWRFDSWMKEWCWCFDYMITADSQTVDKYKEIGYSNIILSNFGYNPHIYKKKNLSKIYDVTFIGQPHSNRREIMDELSSKGISVKCFGYGWKLNLYKRAWNKLFKKFKVNSLLFDTGRVTTEQMVDIFNQSKVNINLTGTNSLNSPNKVNGRFFEITGCGSFMLCEECFGADKFLVDGKDYVSFNSIEDLAKKINYYIENEKEREKIAESGYEKSASFRYDVILKNIFDNTTLKNR